MSSILVVGSLAYDSIQTPSGKVDRALGGSANYFSVAASLFTGVRVVGVVGEDYDQEDIDILNKRGVDTAGMLRAYGKTFHWEGYYEGDLNEARTLKTELNVFESFDPVLPESYVDTPYVFLANIAPELQLKVLEQVKSPIFVGSDTMNFWISTKIDELKKVLKKVNVLLINEGEAKMLTGKQNAIAAAADIVKMGPKWVVIKRGEYGFAMFGPEGYFILPAFPVPDVVDPTGAGDSFAGGFFGYLAQKNQPVTSDLLKRACVLGSVVASFTIQGFGLDKIKSVHFDHLAKRLEEFKKIVKIEGF